MCRTKYAIPSKKGKAPSFSVMFENDGTGTSTFTPNGITHKLRPDFQITPRSNGAFDVTASGSEADVAHFLRGFIKKQFKVTGRKIPSDTLLDEFINKELSNAQRKPITHFSGQVMMSQLPIERGMAKIALGAGHLFLGDQWSFSKSTDPLRAILKLEKFNPKVIEEATSIPNDEFRTSIIGENVWRTDSHFLAILPERRKLQIVINLFGEISLTRVYRLENTINYSLYSNLDKSALCIPLNRKQPPEWFGLHEFLFFRRIMLKDAIENPFS
ncbi:hypothetical protein [Aliiroseovarius crassostreae]|nr:hypothetical protein [Aliiroseovarius crassostreae]